MTIAMRTNSHAVQMILASFISAGSSAVFLVFLTLLVALAGAAQDVGTMAAGLAMSLSMGAVLGVGLAVPIALVAGLPTFFAGTFLWDLGRTRRWARHPLAFAVAGLIIGLAAYGLLFGTSLLSRTDVPFLEEHGPATVPIIFGCAGAGAGIVFRSSAALLGRWLKLNEADPQPN